MKINNEFEFGEIVYLKTDTEQHPRIIVAMEIYHDGDILYKLNKDSFSSYHFHYEFSRDKKYNF